MLAIAFDAIDKGLLDLTSPSPQSTRLARPDNCFLRYRNCILHFGGYRLLLGVSADPRASKIAETRNGSKLK